MVTGLVEAVVYRPADGTVRRWTCPRCCRRLDVVEPPPGWIVFRPFDRVLACCDCADGAIAELLAEGML